jgi:hypothetical protein
MRQRLFRAWHEEDKTMVYFDPKKLISDMYQAQHLMKLINGGYGDMLMDWIGLTDKKGIKIFEGDKFNNPDEDDGFFVIEWSDERARFLAVLYGHAEFTNEGGGQEFENHISKISDSDLEPEDFVDYPIIGNIHEAKG